jgi:hypothetical protein
MLYDPKSIDYKNYEKLISEAKKDAVNKAEWQRKIGEEDHKMSQTFFKQAYTEEHKKQKDVETRANVEAAQKYTEQALYGPNSWQNYDLSPEDLKKLSSDKNYTPQNRKIKERVLTDVNRVRELSGLPLLTEKQIQVPMKEYRDWGLFHTGETMTSEPGYRYEEGKAPARRSAAPSTPGAPQVVRYGTHNGRRVAQYQDGRTEYVQ